MLITNQKKMPALPPLGISLMSSSTVNPIKNWGDKTCLLVIYNLLLFESEAIAEIKTMLIPLSNTHITAS